LDTSLQNELKSVEWKEFKIGDLFKLETCKCKNASLLKKGGNVPYVGATNNRNGTMYFVHKEESLMTKGNCIVFVQDGEGSMGTSFYKKEDFIGSTTLTVGYNENLNLYTGTFITTISDKVRSKYNFGYKRNLERLKNERIMLPINDDETPNWSFMENFMKEVEKVVKPKMKFEKHQITDNRELDEVEWGEFKIEDIFHIKSGKRLTKKEMKNGKIPFVGSTNRNNGITNFVSNQNNSMDSNVLGVNYNGSVVENFYHPYKCIFSDDVKRLSLKGMVGNKYIYLFIKTMILMQKKKYAYGYKFNGQRMKRQVILLPVTEKGQPDWNFMEQYMKRMENEILSQKEIQ
jgi:Type I restriction modification DNA specificity domain